MVSEVEPRESSLLKFLDPRVRGDDKVNMYKKADHVEGQLVEGALILIDTRESELLQLNEVGAAVWEAIDEKKTSEDIIRNVQSQFEGAPASQIRKDVLGFLRHLLERELIQPANA